MDIIFHTNEEIDIGTTIDLKIFSPAESKPVNAKGVLKWIENKKIVSLVVLGGIKLALSQSLPSAVESALWTFF